jgi:hypothetical protein
MYFILCLACDSESSAKIRGLEFCCLPCVTTLNTQTFGGLIGKTRVK